MCLLLIILLLEGILAPPQLITHPTPVQCSAVFVTACDWSCWEDTAAKSQHHYTLPLLYFIHFPCHMSPVLFWTALRRLFSTLQPALLYLPVSLSSFVQGTYSYLKGEARKEGRLLLQQQVLSVFWAMTSPCCLPHKAFPHHTSIMTQPCDHSMSPVLCTPAPHSLPHCHIT